MSAAAPLALEDAQRQLLALVSPLQVQRVEIEGALGRYLAEPLRARRSQPAADLSAMDGYAVTADDLRGPWHIVGESSAGHPYSGRILPGQAIRISTGAVIPEDAASVILQEDVVVKEQHMTLSGAPPAPPQKHIRPFAMDFAEGTEVIPAGLPVTPARMALAIAAGHTHILVHRTPRLIVIDSGDELVTNPAHCALHHTPASNGTMIAAMAQSMSVDARRIGPVPDDRDAIVSAFEASGDADVIVTSGGASVGDHDLIRPALMRWGADIQFWRIAIKPGKPILVATRERSDRRQILLGLPGNPVSSYVTAYHFLLPLLRAMQGALLPLPMSLTAPLESALRSGGKRREFLRGWWDGKSVRVNPLQDSGVLTSLASSNVLVDRPAMAPSAQPGDEVEIFLLHNGSFA